MEGQQYKRWDSNSAHGQLLLSLIANKQIPDKMPTQTVQELYPQFRSYSSNNFSSILSRFRKNVANGKYAHCTPGAPPTSSAHVTPAEFASNYYANPSK
jgi:hypothetical protein